MQRWSWLKSVSGGRLLKFFAAGSVLGATFDQIHVRFQVLAYPRDDYFQQSWWVAPNFGLATLLMLLGSLWMAPRAEKLDPRPPTVRDYALGTAWFLAAYLASGLLVAWPGALVALYAATFAGRLVARPDRLPVLLHALGIAAGGVLAESILAGSGAFWYLDPHVAHVPVWLPGIYLHGGPLALAVAKGLRAWDRRADAATATAALEPQRATS